MADSVAMMTASGAETRVSLMENLLSILTRLLAWQINPQLLNQAPETGGAWE